MARYVLIMGDSGSGKSASLRNFTPEEIGIFSVTNKDLPFKGKLKPLKNATYEDIAKHLANPTRKALMTLAICFRLNCLTGQKKLAMVSLLTWQRTLLIC